MSTALSAGVANSLSISLVSYKSDQQLLLRTLNSLRVAISALQAAQQFHVTLSLIDNGNEADSLVRLMQQSELQQMGHVIRNNSNVGFGAANNQCIKAASSEFHLVLNPDVELAPDALTVGVGYLQRHPEVVAVSPRCTNGVGASEFLCKRYPAITDLLLRGFAPAPLKQCFRKRLAHYEYQQLVLANDNAAVELISGCFMLCRTPALQQAGGFDERYFLYFEDFALSLELGKLGELHFVPGCHIVHHGGGAARKGLKHIRHFVQSAGRFYYRYGWKFW